MTLSRSVLSGCAVLCFLAVGAAFAGCEGGIEGACQQYAAATCTSVRDCYPAGLFPDDYCESRYAVICEAYYGPEGAGVSPDSVRACADALSGLSCDELGAPIEACVFHGSKAAGDPCFLGFECQSGACYKDFGESCGACGATAPKPGDACGDDPAICAASGLYCSSGACAEAGVPGDACSMTAPCHYAFRCADGKCTTRMSEGEACEPSEYACALSLYCNTVTHECEPYVVVQAGEPCSYDQATGQAPVCTIDTICHAATPGAELTCLVPAKDGDPCDETYPQCEFGATCNNGVCEAGTPECK